MKPKRIQLSRRAGFNLQAASQALNGLPAVNCARPSMFGNPFVVDGEKTKEDCVGLHQEWLDGLWGDSIEFEKLLKVMLMLHTLKGKNLACYCEPDERCHCDNLLKMAAKL